MVIHCPCYNSPTEGNKTNMANLSGIVSELQSSDDNAIYY
jgi:hypothetical protein